MAAHPPGQPIAVGAAALAECGLMSDSAPGPYSGPAGPHGRHDAPDLHMLNVVVGDMAATLGFYRRLGVAVPGPDEATGGHIQLRMPGGFSLELDTAESARLWHAGWRADPASARVVTGFSLPTRAAVDGRYAELTSGSDRPIWARIGRD